MLRVGIGSEDIGKVVFTLVLDSEVTNTWRRAFVAASNEGQWTRAFVEASASIVAVGTNASVAPCAPQKTCINIAVTIWSRLSDPVPLSDLTAWQRLKESESVKHTTHTHPHIIIIIITIINFIIVIFLL